ncbi:NAD-dependent protein deacylase Sirt4-like [Oratosquilla oratoria]|uniref:NAD-dependent protein deacylase Sirt4-like n=1 Tax=Oratosquilla oratoria TaxID=337810 RepID=UPI003F76B49C
MNTNILKIKKLVKLVTQRELKGVTRHCSLLAFVPKHEPCHLEAQERLQNFIDSKQRLFIITGAGISTESGIPDYRSEGVGLYATSSTRPVEYRDFVSSAKVRQRYWARNYAGWPRFSSFSPNVSHFTLADWERKGKVQCVVTQNVDRLHHKAGSQNTIELHGTAFKVTCLSCHHIVSRHSFQNRLMSENPHMRLRETDVRPDGDVTLSQEEVELFKVPTCEKCGGVMKPYIVFFGDNVPRERVNDVRSQLTMSDGVLVLGSSLYVYSGYRFILQAVEEGKDIAAVNIGTTRADKHISLRVSARCGEVLPSIVL